MNFNLVIFPGAIVFFWITFFCSFSIRHVNVVLAMFIMYRGHVFRIPENVGYFIRNGWKYRFQQQD